MLQAKISIKKVLWCDIRQGLNSFYGKRLKKEPDILLFNPINKSEDDFWTVPIKIDLKKTNPETTLAWRKFLKICHPCTII